MSSMTGAVRDAVAVICERTTWYVGHAGAVKCDDPQVAPSRAALGVVARWVETNFKKELMLLGANVELSKGRGNAPKTPYVCIVPKGHMVSNGVYVVCCFGTTGVVCGVARSQKLVGQLASFAGLPTTPRTRKAGAAQSPVVDVDNGSQKYNDLFVNPREFTSSEFDEAEFVLHLRSSLERLAIELGLDAASTNETTRLTTAGEPVSPETDAVLRAALNQVGIADADDTPLRLLTSP